MAESIRFASCHQVVLKRLFTSKTNRPPLSIKSISRFMAREGNEVRLGQPRRHVQRCPSAHPALMLQRVAASLPCPRPGRAHRTRLRCVLARSPTRPACLRCPR
jgi:hypothetical protein